MKESVLALKNYPTWLSASNYLHFQKLCFKEYIKILALEISIVCIYNTLCIIHVALWRTSYLEKIYTWTQYNSTKLCKLYITICYLYSLKTTLMFTILHFSLTVYQITVFLAWAIQIKCRVYDLFKCCRSTLNTYTVLLSLLFTTKKKQRLLEAN